MSKLTLQYIELRRKLLEQVKSRVQLIEGTSDSELKAYFLPYKNEFHKQKWTPVQRSQLIGDLLAADIVIGGDFHAFAQSQRTHLRLLRSLKKINRPAYLALECFESKDQAIVDAYTTGNLPVDEFLTKINWDEHWGFPWKNYAPLVRFALKNGYKIIAINSRSQIDQQEGEGTELRDRHIAQILCHIKKTDPDAFIYTVIGDLHLSSGHLPLQINQLAKDLNIQSVFQNSEKLYFDLLGRGLENKVDIMKSKKNQYCIITSPPWVKWQSYLICLEAGDDVEFEGGDFDSDGDEYYDDDYDENFLEYYDSTDLLFSIFDFFKTDLGLDLSFDGADVFSQVSDFLLERVDNELSEEESNVVKTLIQNSMSFYLPTLSTLFLSRNTTNYASELVGKYIHAELCARKNNLLTLPRDFKPLIWVETISYFMSKIYNHKRKTMSFKNLKVELATINPEDKNHEILKLSLGQTVSEYFSSDSISKIKENATIEREALNYIESARILGQYKGEQLYLAYRSGAISKNQLLIYLKKNLDDTDFADFYQSIVEMLLSKSGSKDKKEYIL